MRNIQVDDQWAEFLINSGVASAIENGGEPLPEVLLRFPVVRASFDELNTNIAEEIINHWPALLARIYRKGKNGILPDFMAKSLWDIVAASQRYIATAETWMKAAEMNEIDRLFDVMQHRPVQVSFPKDGQGGSGVRYDHTDNLVRAIIKELVEIGALEGTERKSPAPPDRTGRMP